MQKQDFESVFNSVEEEKNKQWQIQQGSQIISKELEQKEDQSKKISNQNQNQVLSEKQQNGKPQESEEQIPDHFYDSDIASVCQKDFQSDNEPPKDIVQQRKRLYKQKFLHVFKTIIRVGTGIDKPARYDLMKMKYKQVPQNQVIKKKKKQKKEDESGTTQFKQLDHKQTKQTQEKQNANSNNAQQQVVQEQNKPLKQGEQPINPDIQDRLNNQKNFKKQQDEKNEQYPAYYKTVYLDDIPLKEYNLGNQLQEIQRLVTSMKRGEVALFELQHLQTSKKSNIKIRKLTQVFLIQVFDWTTVIDLQGDKKLLKYVHNKGEGPFRIAMHDQVTFTYQISKSGFSIIDENLQNQKIQEEFLSQHPKIFWRTISSMKEKERIQLTMSDQIFQQYQGKEQFQKMCQILMERIQSQGQSYNFIIAKGQPWVLRIMIEKLQKVDDIYLNGKILKKTLIKGVSTAKPESSSLVYYALKFINQKKETIKQDECFESDWWQSFQKLQQLKCRKNYLDDYKISRMLKTAIKRMKPGQISEIQCRDNSLFQFGSDFQQMKQLLKFQQVPQVVFLIVRVYNFTQSRTAFNLQLEGKIQQSKRKKIIAIQLLKDGKIKKALKRFSNIVALYSSDKINQEAYDQKISALMNSVLCHMKMKNYIEMIKLCNQILQAPRHGHDINDLKINGPGHAKIQGKLPQNNNQNSNSQDTRRFADLMQNKKILDKCLYRKAYALCQTGQNQAALECLQKIEQKSEQSQKLKEQALKGKLKYEEKSKKIFKSMFG